VRTAVDTAADQASLHWGSVVTNWRDMDPYDGAPHPDAPDHRDATDWEDPMASVFDPRDDADLADYRGEWKPR